jgi:ABC-type multidrug transport system ATPase subunit
MTEKVALAEATDLAKRWADNAGLQPFSFGLWSNELVVVRGRSGSGKSTLLALLAGWTPSDGGTLVRLGPWAERGVDRTWKGTAILPQVIARSWS